MSAHHVNRIRVVTYNVHRCRGLDGRVRPARIARVLRRIGADVVALQEVLSRDADGLEADQVGFIARALGLRASHGVNRMIDGARYGNVVLAAHPHGGTRNYDVTVAGCEPRGCLRVDLETVQGHLLHVLNLHLGVGIAERREQARLIDGTGMLDAEALPGSRILLGDFNEWTQGLTTRLLGSRLKQARPNGWLRWPWSYPGIVPIASIDRIYYDGALELRSIKVVRSPEALLASDHLPIVAEFEVSRARPRR